MTGSNKVFAVLLNFDVVTTEGRLPGIVCHTTLAIELDGESGEWVVSHPDEAGRLVWALKVFVHKDALQCDLLSVSAVPLWNPRVLAHPLRTHVVFDIQKLFAAANPAEAGFGLTLAAAVVDYLRGTPMGKSNPFRDCILSNTGRGFSQVSSGIGGVRLIQHELTEAE